MTDTFVKLINEIEQNILLRQNGESGLYSASTAISQHGNYQDAWVRDNLYSNMSIWGAWIALKQQPEGQQRFSALADKFESAICKNMRGLLNSMTKQADKVERFKVSQNPTDALHAKFDSETGDVVVGDDEWGHLQLDATSLYLLMLAQITESGLAIIKTESELNFIQNLVYYIGKGYQTPDFGIWERGNKINNGLREIHASSVGMVKSALQAIQKVEFNIDGSDQALKIHVNEDEIARCRLTLNQLLPRESLSKEVDAANLSIIGFPAFAVEDHDLVAQTEAKIVENLEGEYGFKRFLLDGHQTVLEDPNRLHYNLLEVKNFEHIESEWPLFDAFQYVNASFSNDIEKRVVSRQKLKRNMVNGLLPELYFVSESHIDAERKKPGSQPRNANENLPLSWAQSLWYLGQLLEQESITPNQIDPLGMHKQQLPKDHLVRLSFIAENDFVRERLELNGIPCDIHNQQMDAKILPSTEYASVLSRYGQDEKLKLTGMPFKRPRSLSTAKSYVIDGQKTVFIPGFQNRTSFYFASDYRFLVDKLKAEIKLISRNWVYESDPFILVLVTEEMLRSVHSTVLLTETNKMLAGSLGSTQVLNCPLSETIAHSQQEVINTQGKYQFPEKFLPKRLKREYLLKYNPEQIAPVKQSVLTFLEPESAPEELIASIRASENIYEQLDKLMRLLVTKGNYPLGIGNELKVLDLIEEIYARACENELWNLIRKTAAILGKYWGSLEDSVSEVLSRQKMLIVGRSYNDIGLIRHPMNNEQILKLLRKNTGYDEREAIINQEIIVLLSILLKQQPESFSGVLTLRTGQFAQLIMSKLTDSTDGESSEAFDAICALSPFELLHEVKQVVEHFNQSTEQQFANEALLVSGSPKLETLQLNTKSAFQLGESENWLQWREVQGVIPRINTLFYEGVWQILNQSHGLIIGNRYDRSTRLDSEIVLNTFTSGETQFHHLFEVMLNRIESSSYRQMTIEAIESIVEYVKNFPNFRIENYLIIEVILGHAVRLNWLSNNDNADNYELHKGKAWTEFYMLSPDAVTENIFKAVNFLIEVGMSDSHPTDQPHASLPG